MVCIDDDTIHTNLDIPRVDEQCKKLIQKDFYRLEGYPNDLAINLSED